MFDEGQMRGLQALLDAIIPADDYPGAWEAGVGDYLLRQLQGDLARLLPEYRAWLTGLDEEARAVFGSRFADISMEDRANLLTRIEQNDVRADWTIDPAPFFQVIVEHCAEGYYSDPGNGGNKDGIAWQMLGFEARG